VVHKLISLRHTTRELKRLLIHEIQILGLDGASGLNLSSVAAGLATGSSDQRDVAAVYLNHIFKFVTFAPHLSGGDGLAMFIEHLWNSFQVGNSMAVSGVVNNSYTRGVSTEANLTDMFIPI
jgi:hypothetical protein